MFKIVAAAVALCLCSSVQIISAENDRPIVGILAQEVSQFLLRHYPDKNFDSYVAASYVKFIEGAGGRAVPIL